jgi:hypothetical protein
MPIITIQKNNTFKIDNIYQWDSNRILEIYGLNLSVLPEIHFANAKMSKAVVKQATENTDGVIRVTIPNFLLESAIPIRVFVCTYNGEEFISRYAFTINVIARPKPEDYIAEDDEKIYSYNALENLVNNTVVNLREENTAFRNEVSEEIDTRFKQIETSVQTTCDETVSQVREIVENATIANADTVDGYHAEDFVFASKSGTTVFNPDGSITTTYKDGSKETVVFNEDGSITTTRNTLELGVKTETTRFNDDGSITVTVE